MGTDKTCFIYKITNLINNKVYIGQSIRPQKRWYEHIYISSIKNNYLYHSMKKYGIENFSFEVIAQVLKLEYADECEIQVIRQYNSTDINFGYNIDGGGRFQKIMSNETKIKISKSHIGKKLSENTKLILSQKSAGKKHSEETKVKMKKLLKKPKKIYKVEYPSFSGKRLSDETKRKLREANLGKKASQETKDKMSKSMIGKNSAEKNGMFGVSSENVPCAKLTQIQANEIRKKYSEEKISSIQLAKEYNVSKKTILNILNNKTYKDIS